MMGAEQLLIQGLNSNTSFFNTNQTNSLILLTQEQFLHTQRPILRILHSNMVYCLMRLCLYGKTLQTTHHPGRPLHDTRPRFFLDGPSIRSKMFII